MDITLNHTPIRTSRNYQINDITLKNIKIPTDFSLKKSHLKTKKRDAYASRISVQKEWIT